jgi:hypothetical protein
MAVFVAVDFQAKLHCHLPMDLFANVLHILAFGHLLELLLCEPCLEELSEGLDCLGVKLFTHQHELLTAVFVVQHVVPLECELVGGVHHVAGQEALSKALS